MGDGRGQLPPQWQSHAFRAAFHTDPPPWAAPTKECSSHGTSTTGGRTARVQGFVQRVASRFACNALGRSKAAAFLRMDMARFSAILAKSPPASSQLRVENYNMRLEAIGFCLYVPSFVFFLWLEATAIQSGCV